MPVTRFLLILLVLLNLLALAAARGWLGESAQRGEPERLTNQINPHAITLHQPEPALRPAPATETPPPAASPPTVPLEPEPVEVAIAPTDPPPTPAPVPETSAAPEPLSSAAPAPGGDDEIEPATQAPESEPAPLPLELACIVYDGLGEQQAATLGRSAAAVRATVQASRRMTETASNWWVHIPAPANRTVAEDRVAALRASGINDLFIVRDEGPHKNAISLGMFRTESSARQHLSDLRARRVNDARIIARKPAVFALELRGSRPDIDEVSVELKGNPYGAVARACRP